MSKKKKTSQSALLCKRKTFAVVFLQKWIWVLAFSVLLYITGLAFFAEYTKNEVKRDYYHRNSASVQTITNLAATKEEKAFRNSVQMQLAMAADTHGVMSMLVDSDTKEVIAGCEEQIFLIKSKTEASPQTLLVCAPEEIPGWEEYRQWLQGQKKSFHRYYEQMEFSEIYTNGVSFIPVESSLETTATNTVEYMLTRYNYEVEQIRNTIFKTSGNIPEGYEKIDVTEGYMGTLITGYHPTSPCLENNTCCDKAYNILQERYEAFKLTGNINGFAGTESIDTFTLEMRSIMELKLNDERSVTLLSVCYFDVWEVYGGWLIAVAVILLALGVISAYVMARLNYAHLKAQYDMEDYRKTLMNTMAHDLKSPLTSISGYAENLQENIHSEKREYYSQAIRKDVQYMNQIIDSVLELSKTESGTVPLKKEVVNVKELIHEVLERYEAQIKEKILHVEAEGELSVEADAALLAQALDNLLGNAVKHAAENSAIQIRMDSQKICFINHCKENLSEVISTLEEPFVVGDASRSGKKGSGLGLAIVKNICRLHGFGFQVQYEEGLFEASIEV